MVHGCVVLRVTTTVGGFLVNGETTEVVTPDTNRRLGERFVAEMVAFVVSFG